MRSFIFAALTLSVAALPAVQTNIPPKPSGILSVPKAIVPLIPKYPNSTIVATKSPTLPTQALLPPKLAPKPVSIGTAPSVPKPAPTVAPVAPKPAPPAVVAPKPLSPPAPVAPKPVIAPTPVAPKPVTLPAPIVPKPAPVAPKATTIPTPPTPKSPEVPKPVVPLPKIIPAPKPVPSTAPLPKVVPSPMVPKVWPHPFSAGSEDDEDDE